MLRALAVICCAVLAGCAASAAQPEERHPDQARAAGAETPHGDGEERTASQTARVEPEEPPVAAREDAAPTDTAAREDAAPTDTATAASAQPPRAPITIEHDPLAPACPALRHTVPDGDVIPTFTVPRASRRAMSDLLDRLAQSVIASGDGQCDVVALSLWCRWCAGPQAATATSHRT